jgi:hypothetical protein
MEDAANIYVSGVAPTLGGQPPSLSLQARGIAVDDADGSSSDGYGRQTLRFEFDAPADACHQLLAAMPGRCGKRVSSAPPQLPIQLRWSAPVGLTMTSTHATGLVFTQNLPGSWAFGGHGGRLQTTVTCSEGALLYVNGDRDGIDVCGSRSMVPFTGRVRPPTTRPYRRLAISADAATRVFGDFDARAAVIKSDDATVAMGGVAGRSRMLGGDGLAVDAADDATLRLGLTTVDGSIRMMLSGGARSVRADDDELLPTRYEQDPGLWVSILTLASGILFPTIIVELFQLRDWRRLHKDTG